MKHQISGVAIRLGEDRIISLPEPYRHHHVIRVASYLGEKIPIIGEQGFVDAEGAFLDREEALEVAVTCGLIDWSHDRELFSEDLW